MMRMSIGAIACALLSVACAPSEAESAVSETAANLRQVESGTIELRLVARQESGQDAVGFELQGPFSFAEGTALPVAEIEYTQLAGPEKASFTFLSTGEEAFVEVDGRAFELPDDQLASMRMDEEPRETTGFGRLRLGRWLKEAQLNRGEGVDTVTGELNVVNVVNDLLALAADFGTEIAPGVERLEGQDAEQLERAVRSSAFELETGSQDRMLQRLVMEVTFAPPEDEELPQPLRDLEGAVVRMELAVEEPNREVNVEAPAQAQPYAELESQTTP